MIDEDSTVIYKGEEVNLEELSHLTGISYEVVVSRAEKCLDLDFITAKDRSVPTYFLEDSYYTLVELSTMFGVSSKSLFNNIVKLGFNVEEAVIVSCKQENEEQYLLQNKVTHDEDRS